MTNRPPTDGGLFHVKTASNVGYWQRHFGAPQNLSPIGQPAQPIDATQALNLSAGVSNCKVSRGRSFQHPLPVQPACYMPNSWLVWITGQFRRALKSN
jgi:hypothetical protein